MKAKVFPSSSRGSADYGWLKAKYSFSFSKYYDPERVHFGMLRVLNDDYVEPGQGFGWHPHDNMEIITIPLEGAIEHKDSMGNSSVINAGDVQVMSAGTGIFHSEFNHFKDQALRLFQLWVFPKVSNVEPRYDQKTFDAKDRINKWQTVVSPQGEDGSLWVHQDTWFNLTQIEEKNTLPYYLHSEKNGIYIMVIKGKVKIGDQVLLTRDAMGVFEASEVLFEAEENTDLLVVEVPMN